MIRRTACLIARDVDPYRNQAIEKHLMDTLPEETAILFLWQSRRSVLVGRGQNAWYECPVDQFTLSGGLIGRRLSGGGAVCLDEGCLNAAFILPKNEFDIPRQLGILGMAVGALGVQAQASGRHDLGTAAGRFCTNVFYKSGSAATHTATLMVNAGLGAMKQALEVEEGRVPGHYHMPPPASVNLADVNEAITMESLQQSIYWAFARAFGAEPSMLDERMLHARSIEQLTQHFCDRAWIFPQTPPYTFSVAERFPWGGAAVQMLAEGGVIRAARIYTDAMECGLFEQIEQALVGAPFLISAIGVRFEQQLAWIGAPRLRQMASDVCTLICGRIREMDRSGGNKEMK